MSMHMKTKQRLVGLLVLLAILAIFLPVLFHTSRPSTEVHLSMKLPPKPPQPQVTLSESASNAALATPKKEASELGTPLPAALPQIPQPKQIENPGMPPTQSPEVVVPTKPHQQPIKAVKLKHSLKRLLTTPEAWVVQLGTFREKRHADQLIKELREKGFDAYARPFDLRGEHLTRVYVGPEIRLNSANQLRKKLRRIFHLNGVVRKYQI